MALDNDFMRDMQALAGTFAHLFGGEEGVKNFVPNVLRDTTAIVFHFDTGVFSIGIRADAQQPLMRCVFIAVFFFF